MTAGSPGGRVAILHLGRAAAMGEQRRVRSWVETLDAAGIGSVVIGLTGEHPAGVAHLAGSAVDVLRGRAVPETLAWDLRSARETLRRLHPDAIVCVSARAYHPALLSTGVPVVLDYVDALSRSYADRGRIAAGPAARLGFAALARLHRRFERRPVGTARRVAAGYTDAQRLGAEWLPIVAAPLSPAPPRPDADLLFVGTLRYPPNIAALRRLGRVWPDVVRRRPGTTMLVAGSAPVDEVTRLCATHGWTLCPDFDDVAAVYARGRLAVAPLEQTAGIQIKVLDAAVLGVAQVVSPPALEGLAPGFPVRVAASDAELVDAMVALLDDDDARAELAAAAARHVEESYSARGWAAPAAAMLGLGAS